MAVSNAKSHPVTATGKHETAIAFLTDLEDQLEVAQVQMELWHAVVPHASTPGELGQQIILLQQRLFTITEVCRLQGISERTYFLMLSSAISVICGAA